MNYSLRSEARKLLEGLDDVLEDLLNETKNAKYYAVLFSSGISFIDYKKFNDMTPSVVFAMSGIFSTSWTGKEHEPTEENARWVHEFVVSSILNWQLAGLEPTVPENAGEETRKIVKQGYSIFK